MDRKRTIDRKLAGVSVGIDVTSHEYSEYTSGFRYFLHFVTFPHSNSYCIVRPKLVLLFYKLAHATTKDLR